MIQGGCPDGTGMGGPGLQYKGRVLHLTGSNPLKHREGCQVAMARSMRPDSAGSQFFIMHQDAPHLDGQYARAFGRVVEGMDMVRTKSPTVPTDFRDRPKIDMVIKSVTLADEPVEEPERI